MKARILANLLANATLTIAAGQAAVLGARLAFANPQEGGALAELDLSPAETTG
ncbi:hypothetical protein ABZ897_33610 [Nonomuraea sp. NPDC046802]|uniref:hypothetical protein n=1 Tax=Nonomuraea sp. NPDC046802 TaxID=3154919 RepID=UPI0033CEAA1B